MIAGLLVTIYCNSPGGDAAAVYQIRLFIRLYSVITATVQRP